MKLKTIEQVSIEHFLKREREIVEQLKVRQQWWRLKSSPGAGRGWSTYIPTIFFILPSNLMRWYFFYHSNMKETEEPGGWMMTKQSCFQEEESVLSGSLQLCDTEKWVCTQDLGSFACTEHARLMTEFQTQMFDCVSPGRIFCFWDPQLLCFIENRDNDDLEEVWKLFLEHIFPSSWFINSQ